MLCVSLMWMYACWFALLNKTLKIHDFHDYSWYLILFICFWLDFFFALHLHISIAMLTESKASWTTNTQKKKIRREKQQQTTVKIFNAIESNKHAVFQCSEIIVVVFVVGALIEAVVLFKYWHGYKHSMKEINVRK